MHLLVHALELRVTERLAELVVVAALEQLIRSRAALAKRLQNCDVLLAILATRLDEVGRALLPRELCLLQALLL